MESINNNKSVVQLVALENCKELMRKLGVNEPIVEIYHSSPEAIVESINKQEENKDSKKSKGLKLLISAGIVTLPAIVVLLSKNNTNVEEIMAWIIIIISTFMAMGFGLKGVFELLEILDIKSYLEATKAYIKEYYPELKEKAETTEEVTGKARVKKENKSST